MTNGELNTALYQKMFAEQQDFTAWLKEQPADMILHHAYDYVMREDILLSLEYNDLTDRYATVLLDMDKPLAAVFDKLEHSESPHMEHVWECVEQCAKETLEAQQMTGLPIYPHSAVYARSTKASAGAATLHSSTASAEGECTCKKTPTRKEPQR